jgi:hypothetical protein
MFTHSATADSVRVTTLAQLDTVVSAGEAIEVPVPPLTFNCSVVAAAVYQHGTPVTS